jgi:hypothetical protein
MKDQRRPTGMSDLRRKAHSVTYTSQPQQCRQRILVCGEVISRAKTKSHVAPEGELTLATLASQNTVVFSLELQHDHRHGEVV